MSKTNFFFIFFIWCLYMTSPLQLGAQGLPPDWDYKMTSTFHIIAITLETDPSISGVTLSPGDYIGVFYWDEDTLKCGGASEWLGDQNIAITAYGNDNFTTEKDGFDAGEPINFKMFSYNYDDDYEATAVWDPAQPNHDGLFYPKGLSALLSLDAIGPLTAQATALPSLICIGTTSQLFGVANGGSGTFTYSWTSSPAGFVSTEENPYVTPLDSTDYFLEVYDGVSFAYDTTYIDVNQIPQTFAGNDTTICENSSVQLLGEAFYYSSIEWTTPGDGQFDDATILDPVYTPGMNDLESGSVRLTLSAAPIDPCNDPIEDHIYIYVTSLPFADAGQDGTICSYETYTTSGTVENASFNQWLTDGDGNFNDPTSLSAIYTPGPGDMENGAVNLTLEAYPNSPCLLIDTDEITLTINQAPLVFAGNDQSIPFGTSTTLEGDASGGSESYIWMWEPQDMLVSPEIQNPLTINLNNTIDFTLTVTDENTSCYATDGVIVYITGGPLSVEALAHPDEICIGSGSHLNALPSGGSGDYTYSWTSDPPGFTSNLADPMVYPETTTTYFINVFDGFNNASASVQVTVLLPPMSDAGEDLSIPHGTSTSLTGSATGGSGTYNWSWSPAIYLVDASAQNPQTINLYESVDFELMVTDQQSGCFDVDSVLISISGGPLSVTVSANPDGICYGDMTQLSAFASGGSGTYNYFWTSDPPGFTSSDPSPVVIPEETTSYFIEVDDGYNQVAGSSTVVVYSLPEINISVFPNDTVCLFDIITLDATTQGGIEYLWSPDGQTSPVIMFDSTGIGAGSKTFSVEVTNLNQCVDTDEVKVTFDNCTGINEEEFEGDFLVYPNPGGDQVIVEVNQTSWQLAVGSWQPSIGNDCRVWVEVFDVWGRLLYEAEFEGNSSKLLINTSNWKGGLYIVFLRSQNQKIATKKLIINH